MPERIALADLERTPHERVFDRPRTVRLSIDEGERVPPHSHPDTDVVLVCLSGRLELSLDGDIYEVGADELVRFSGDREVAPVAREDTIAVIVFAPAVAE